MCESMLRITDLVSPVLTAALLPHIDDLCEVRVRADRPIVVYILMLPYYVKADGTLSSCKCEDLLTVSFERLRDIFSALCEYSVYKHLDNAANGFVTFSGGHRIGVCGSAVTEGGKVVSVCDVTSLNIRAARQIRGCSDILFDSGDLSRGILLCGAPSSGKTTILRDTARVLSVCKQKKVAVIDERLEISSCFSGHCGFDIGLSDVYCGYPKSTAIVLSVRTMSPDYIICDELTGDDCEAVSVCFNCGAAIIAAVHSDSLSAAKNNQTVRKLMSTGAFSRIVFLDGRIPAGVSGVIKTEEFFK